MFGLHLSSDIRLPDLPTADGGAPPDVRILSVELPRGLPTRPHTVALGDTVLLNIDGVARYLISGGDEILVERASGAAEENVRLYLMGSALGLLLHQRGCLPLHANAVDIGGRAAAFMGRSGAGKSTLAAWFHDDGYRVLADDVSVVRFADDGLPSVAAGVPRLRLWKDAMLATGRETDDFPLSYAGDKDYQKYDVPIGVILDDCVPLGAIYLLERGEAFGITELSGAEKADTLFANTYRGGFIRSVGNARSHWSSCVALVGQTPVFRLSRKWGFQRLDRDIESIVAHFASLHAQNLVNSHD